MTEPLSVAFVAGPSGMWRMDGIVAPHGDALPPAARLAVLEGTDAGGPGSRWVLRGSATDDHDEGQPLGRPEARLGALLAVRKSPSWWDMASEERLRVLGDRGSDLELAAHPSISRRLYRSRDLGEPFDFLVWFEFVPDDEAAFEELLGLLRTSDEWSFVEREVDVRVTR